MHINLFSIIEDCLINRKLSKVNQPLISIILPSYNSEKTIKSTLESIESQSYDNWELLIVDDASTDFSVEILKNISKNEKVSLYLNSNNQGVAYSRNIGLFYAKGDYITFHDADDTSHPERLKYQLYYSILSKFKIVVPKYVRVNNEGISYIINGKKRWNRVSGMMFPKAIVSEIGYFKDTHISEDSEYHERILAFYGKNSRKIINKTLYYALFSLNSLLFSNADVEIKGNKINYKIKDVEAVVLEEFRAEHRKIKAGNMSPYQPFKLDENITSLYSG